MKIPKTSVSVILFATFFFGQIFELNAQRSLNYYDLVKRKEQAQASFDNFSLPTKDDDRVQFVTVFNIPYSSLPFKKNRNRSSKYKYYSTFELTLEVFKAEDANFDEKSMKNISLDDLEQAGRTFWSDTAYAKSYQESNSGNKFISGYIRVNLKPGTYNYVLQMKRGDQTESQISQTKSVKITPFSKKQSGDFLLSPKLISNAQSPRFILNTSGNNVEYAKDFYAVGYIPQYDKNASYTLEITKMSASGRDTTKGNTVFTQPLSPDHFKTDVYPQLQYTNRKPYLSLTSSDNGFTYATVKIPNSNWPNSLYQITIKNDDNSNIVSRDTYRSLWKDIPTSLLNLDVAVEMLRFIADKETVRKISRGSAAEREQKFRSFWKERDPTPNTEYNELLAEYYRRIDYTFENFTTENTLGYNSDRGEIYIKYGPPETIERKFPKSGATTEIWTYPNRTFVFRATTGFGDFKLISNRSR